MDHIKTAWHSAWYSAGITHQRCYRYSAWFNFFLAPALLRQRRSKRVTVHSRYPALCAVPHSHTAAATSSKNFGRPWLINQIRCANKRVIPSCNRKCHKLSENNTASAADMSVGHVWLGAAIFKDKLRRNNMLAKPWSHNFGSNFGRCENDHQIPNALEGYCGGPIQVWNGHLAFISAGVETACVGSPWKLPVNPIWGPWYGIVFAILEVFGGSRIHPRNPLFCWGLL